MTTRRDSILIEISEDAYKQNSVYRPWDEITMDGSSVYLRDATHQPVSPRVISIANSPSSDRSKREQDPPLTP
jgi:hypothetical protein